MHSHKRWHTDRHTLAQSFGCSSSKPSMMDWRSSSMLVGFLLKIVSFKTPQGKKYGGVKWHEWVGFNGITTSKPSVEELIIQLLPHFKRMITCTMVGWKAFRPWSFKILWMAGLSIYKLAAALRIVAPGASVNVSITVVTFSTDLTVLGRQLRGTYLTLPFHQSADWHFELS
jgi:hypothetical protein